MDYKEKYEAYRKIAKSGDIILTHSNKIVAKSIQWIDNCYYHHSEIVDWQRGRLMGFGSHPDGANPVFLSHRFENKKWDDFTVIRPTGYTQRDIDKALNKIYDFAERYYHYDFAMVFDVLASKFNLRAKKKGKIDKNICSELTLQYSKFLGNDFKVREDGYFTPSEHLRQMNHNYKKVI